MKFFKYLKDIKVILFLIILIMSIVNTVLFLDPNLSKSTDSILYINVLVLLCVVLFLWLSFIDYKKKIYKLIAYMNNRNKEYLDMEENFLYENINKLIKENETEVNNLRYELEEINDYMTNWIHEVKIPISVLEIIGRRVSEIDGGKSLSKEIKTEVSRIDKLVEQAMYSSRAGNYNSDFLINEVNLDSIVKDVIKKNKYQFIYNRIDLQVENLDKVVLSDKKWLTHIVELIIDNAIKYSDIGGKIEIYLKNDRKGTELHIRDSGIGIGPQDIERIFDKGFTGENGRKRTKSTGMGLYIAKKILNKLSHDIDVMSNPNEFCDVYITFYNLSDYFNVT